MAILTPDNTFKWNGLKINEYLLTKHNPNNIAMPTIALPSQPIGVTIHNTPWISVSANTTPAEQYTRATLNNNMNDVRVHFYVDDICAWQNLPLTLSGWHAADGSGCGNRKTISIEVIGDSKKAEQNAAKLAAYLLDKYNLTVENGLFTHTHWLNVRDGKKGTIAELNIMKNSYKNCLPIDSTELLTPDGWKNLGDITVDDLVAQYNEGEISFVHPERIVEPYEAETLKTRYLEATGNHRMLVQSYNDKEASYRDMNWQDILEKSTSYRMNTSGLIKSELNLSDDELLLLAWIQGDGHYMEDCNGEVIGLEFHLKKQRKIDRIHFLLNELGINYSDSWCRNDSVHIRVYDKKIYQWAETWLKDKEFTYKLLSMSMEQFNIFTDELFIIDGHKNDRQKIYCSSSLKNLDFIQALCATHLTRSSQCTLGSSKKIYGEQPVCVNFLKTNASFVKNENIQKRRTLVSCVTVPSSYILIRQNHHTFIVGNCPFYILPHWDEFKKMVQNEQKKTPIITIYRIRKDWDDAKSQIGAYNSLENAKKACKDGYSVFDENGKVVYTKNNISTEAQVTPPAAKPVMDKINVKYRAYADGKWWGEIENYNTTNSNGYAGVEGKSIRGLAIKPEKGTIKYRVHIKGGGWLGWMTDYDINNWKTGCAGNKIRDIDAVQMDFSGAEGYKVKYRVSTINAIDYLNWIEGYNTRNSMGYAGIIGKSIDKIQIEIIKK